MTVITKHCTFWRKHPICYADTIDSDLVSAACDVAVNQYLPEPPRNDDSG